MAIGEAVTTAGGEELLPALEGAVAPTADAGSSATALGAENGSLAAACEVTTTLSQFARTRHGALVALHADGNGYQCVPRRLAMGRASVRSPDPSSR